MYTCECMHSPACTSQLGDVTQWLATLLDSHLDMLTSTAVSLTSMFGSKQDNCPDPQCLL
jgi:hypothetical protein